MHLKWKHIAFIQSIVLILLLVFFFYPFHKERPITSVNPKGLLSPRVYAGLIESKSYLIVNYNPLREELKEYINNISEKNATVAVYVENIRDGASMSINGQEGFSPASLSKVPMAILIAKKVEDNELNWSTPLTIENADRTDSWGDLYQTPERQLPLKVVFEKMLKDSDNTAFNVLNHYKDHDDYLNLLWDYYGYYQVNSSDSKTHQVTPKSMYNLFSSLYLSTILQQKDSEYILKLLSNTSFDIHKIANISTDITIAQKFGEKYDDGEQYFHSCGIIYVDDMRVFYCIMTHHLEKDKGQKVIGEILHNIYDYTIISRKNLDFLKE